MMRGLAIAAALLLTAGSPAGVLHAQDMPCTGLASEAAEIACLRALLAEQGQGEAPPAPEPEPAPVERKELGAEQLPSQAPQAEIARREREERKSEAVSAVITDTRLDRRGLLVMQLDNGQIWRQDEDLGLPTGFARDGRTAVTISRSGFGGYRMEFPEEGRRMVVSRLR
ncbi:hypothetical protein [Alteraurantiacibacter aquimixticola]|uniref:Uncharacterized protein n=1 Tax=Alteraurantiacibacter aquimixticola TaxID=2489173 RepID=A0A4T3F482_9SPHN|nr:hypothetical protein [Alteraurantiacibacter aquimixticola]TIX51968.1 hypothetical protein E5222_05925 [Alteraurantiacibacter aquimixticola]